MPFSLDCSHTLRLPILFLLLLCSVLPAALVAESRERPYMMWTAEDIAQKLSEDERDLVETFFREYINHAIYRNSIFAPEVFNDERNYSRYHVRSHRVDNWLPNITFFPGVERQSHGRPLG